jgi:hypothetical protein
MARIAAPVGELVQCPGGWQVASSTGSDTVYTLQYNRFWRRWECDCSDYWFRWRKVGGQCKHLRKLAEVLTEGGAVDVRASAAPGVAVDSPPIGKE